MFPSRNRVSCHFKSVSIWVWKSIRHCFHLGIEFLVISSIAEDTIVANCGVLFQSRNRVSCHFKSSRLVAGMDKTEIVSISESSFLSFQGHNDLARSLRNQVSISESSFFSFQGHCITRAEQSDNFSTFQSRNRVSCHFKQTGGILATHRDRKFQSRNRVSCHFKTDAQQQAVAVTF